MTLNEFKKLARNLGRDHVRGFGEYSMLEAVIVEGILDGTLTDWEQLPEVYQAYLEGMNRDDFSKQSFKSQLSKLRKAIERQGFE